MTNSYKCSQQHHKLYKSEINSILSYLIKQQLTYEQLYLICYQSNIILSPADQLHLKSIFKLNNNLICLNKCFSLLKLKHCEILHNKPIFHVTITNLEKHNENQCFCAWKQIMESKYGIQMRWFDAIAGSNETRKIKSFSFKARIRQILRGSDHESCYQSINLKFPRNAKNQIQWSIFMSIIRRIDCKNDKRQQANICTEKDQKKNVIQGQNHKIWVQEKPGIQQNTRTWTSMAKRQKQKITKNRIKSFSKQNNRKLSLHQDSQQFISSADIQKQKQSIAHKLAFIERMETRKFRKNRATSAKCDTLCSKDINMEKTASTNFKNNLTTQYSSANTQTITNKKYSFDKDTKILFRKVRLYSEAGQKTRNPTEPLQIKCFDI